MKTDTIYTRLFNDTNRNLLSICLLCLRLALGIILFIAGAGKALGWFGGYGMEKTLGFYASIGFSATLCYLSTFTEFIGGLLVAVGLITRPAAIAVTINMLVATIVTLPKGFLGPSGAQTPFMFLVLAIVVLIAGPMDYSFDRLLFGRAEISGYSHPYLETE